MFLVLITVIGILITNAYRFSKLVKKGCFLAPLFLDPMSLTYLKPANARIFLTNFGSADNA